MLYNDSITETADGIRLAGSTVFLLCGDGVVRIRTENGRTQKIACVTDRRTMLAYDDSCVLICSSKRAVFCRFGN